MAKQKRRIYCKFCDFFCYNQEDFVSHLEKKHDEMIPEEESAWQFFYFLRTGKTHGNCIMCKNETTWNEVTHKYNRFCNNPRCKEKYREIFKNRMIGKYGKTTLLNDPEQQKKMLANRKISGEYLWRDHHHKTTYTGSYEKSFLEFLDEVMNFDPNDVIAPSPHTYWYEYEGIKHFYIPDLFIPSLNLEIEIKDGGDNPNMHHKIQDVDKVKEQLKDDVMRKNTFNYLKIVNKDNKKFLDYLNTAKETFYDENRKSIYMVEKESSIDNLNELLTESVDNIYEENVLLNKKDLYKDFDKFESGKSNVLLVTGFSGSGKSTLASQIASKYHAVHYELDCLVFYINGNLTKEQMKGNEDGLLEFVEKHPEIKPGTIPNNKEENNLYEEYIKFLVNWCKTHKDKKYVIEGLQIYEVFDAKNPQSFITSNPVIIKGTSGIVSAYRGTKRNINDMDIKNSSERFKKSVKEFKNMLDWVIYDNPKIEDFSKVFKETMNYLIESEDMSKVNKFHKKDMKFKLSNFKKEIKHHDDKNGKPITITYKDNNKIVAEAYCDTEPASDGYLWFGTFSINENYRNHDLANQFLNEIINKYKVGALAVAKDNEVAIKLYKKFGFIISTERKDDKYYYMYLKKNKMKGD